MDRELVEVCMHLQRWSNVASVKRLRVAFNMLFCVDLMPRQWRLDHIFSLSGSEFCWNDLLYVCQSGFSNPAPVCEFNALPGRKVKTNVTRCFSTWLLVVWFWIDGLDKQMVPWSGLFASHCQKLGTHFTNVKMWQSVGLWSLLHFGFPVVLIPISYTNWKIQLGLGLLLGWL